MNSLFSGIAVGAQPVGLHLEGVPPGVGDIAVSVLEDQCTRRSGFYPGVDLEDGRFGGVSLGPSPEVEARSLDIS